MLFPTDPATRPGLMAATFNLISNKPQIVVVLDGHACVNKTAKLPDSKLIAGLRQQFESANIKRVGSSRDLAIGPVWAFDKVGDMAKLKLCTIQGEAGDLLNEKRWASEVQTIVMNIEFEERDIIELRFPLRLEGVECQGWEKHDDYGGSILRRC